MLPLHVALVPHEEGLVDTHELLRVVAALQIQVTRDFTPVWGISGVVSAFLSLEELPPACIPLVIVHDRSLPARDHGFHITEKGHPVGLIAKREGWSLLASHELLEILCDPQGKRKVLGESIADSHRSQVLASARDYLPQGQVEYLLEVCDPCQTSTYTVNGFEVSDFVTPHYYAPGATQGRHYSFTGKVTRPREVLRGGYITWYTAIRDAPIWQATKDLRGTLTVGPLIVPVPILSRDDNDYYTDIFGAAEPSIADRAQAAEVATLAKRSAERYGRQLQDDIAHILKDTYQTEREHPEVSLKDLLDVLEQLAYDSDYWERFQDPSERSGILTELLGYDIDYYKGQVPPQERFRAVHKSLKDSSTRHAGVERPGFSGKVATIAMQGTT